MGKRPICGVARGESQDLKGSGEIVCVRGFCYKDYDNTSYALVITGLSRHQVIEYKRVSKRLKND